jgi:hypothetical protein
VTVIVNHGLPGGIGGAGIMLQLKAGIVNTAPDVVCANDVVTP